jgi:hypothetical protein
MRLHQFAHHLIPGGQFRLHLLELFLERLLRGFLEGESLLTVFKELRLPSIKNRRLKTVFSANLGNRLLVQQMQFQDLYFSTGVKYLRLPFLFLVIKISSKTDYLID